MALLPPLILIDNRKYKAELGNLFTPSPEYFLSESSAF